MKTFKLEGEYIPLIQLLKATGMVQSGGEAQQVVVAALVSVNGNIETRKRCKICKDDIVQYEKTQIKIV